MGNKGISKRDWDNSQVNLLRTVEMISPLAHCRPPIIDFSKRRFSPAQQGPGCLSWFYQSSILLNWLRQLQQILLQKCQPAACLLYPFSCH
jgi:hypothetical protein